MSIEKVANHAGVSTATVSRVLNNFPGVRAETARQVRLALEALQYDATQVKRARRSGNGSAPRTRRTGTNAIAILTLGQGRDWLQLPVLASAVAGISRGAKDLGFRLLLDEVLDITKPLPTPITREVNGVVVFISSMIHSTETRRVLTEIGSAMPTVWVMGGANGSSNVDHISPDNHAVGHLAFEYLKNNGCRQVAYLTTLPGWPVMRVRGQSFASAAHDASIGCSSYLQSADARDGEVFGRGAIVEAELETLIDRLVNSQPRPTGLFVSTDELTVRIYPILRRLGVRPGKDITIVSCDNEQIRLSGLSPRPASIDIGAEEAGWRAVHRLAIRLESANDPAVSINIAPRLVGPEAEVTSVPAH